MQIYDLDGLIQVIQEYELAGKTGIIYTDRKTSLTVHYIDLLRVLKRNEVNIIEEELKEDFEQEEAISLSSENKEIDFYLCYGTFYLESAAKIQAYKYENKDFSITELEQNNSQKIKLSTYSKPFIAVISNYELGANISSEITSLRGKDYHFNELETTALIVEPKLFQLVSNNEKIIGTFKVLMLIFDLLMFNNLKIEDYQQLIIYYQEIVKIYNQTINYLNEQEKINLFKIYSSILKISKNYNHGFIKILSNSLFEEYPLNKGYINQVYLLHTISYLKDYNEGAQQWLKQLIKDLNYKTIDDVTAFLENLVIESENKFNLKGYKIPEEDYFSMIAKFQGEVYEQVRKLDLKFQLTEENIEVILINSFN